MKNVFKYKESSPNCDIFDKASSSISIVFRSTNHSTRFDRRLNFTNALRYMGLFKSAKNYHVKFWDIKGGFDIDTIYDNLAFYTIQISNSRLKFYYNMRKIGSCQDIIDFNITRIQSIFQTISNFFILRNLDQKQSTICPLVLNNTNIVYFALTDSTDTFYKRNILSFSNDNFQQQLKSNIKSIELYNVENINLDSNLINPSVFNSTTLMEIVSGSLNSINGEIFKNLSRLSRIGIYPNIFRKINHKQGIGWIRQINYGLNVNFSETKASEISPKEIILKSNQKGIPIKMTSILPDEDFCLYVDFPFDQLVIVYEYNDNMVLDKGFVDKEYTCTHLWLARYYEYFYKLLLKIKRGQLDKLHQSSLLRVLNSTSYKRIYSCKFEEKIRLCSKSNYHRKDIWDVNDFYILNRGLQIGFKILLYPVSFLGLATNLIVILVIQKKENSDLFKEYKQYSYLCLNSIFCVMISVIEILSWMTECFYPFEVFCPDSRKLVAIQFFRIIFKECLVTILRYMLNFTYFAFALNRISLIGKDHGKLVTFISELGIKKYILVTTLISCSFFWIKYFKYEINYYYSDLNFPISNEMEIIESRSYRFRDFYFIYNSISDLVNYLVFVVICVVIDIYMVVKLRRTLNEKALKKNHQNMKNAEFEEVVNKAIKMVVLNSSIGILFKLPVCFIPLLNVVSQFYFKKYSNVLYNISFGLFYINFIDSSFYSIIQDLSHLFYNLSLSIQMFIYNRFDKKFRTGFDRLMEKKSSPTEPFSKTSAIVPERKNLPME